MKPRIKASIKSVRWLAPPYNSKNKTDSRRRLKYHTVNTPGLEQACFAPNKSLAWLVCSYTRSGGDRIGVESRSTLESAVMHPPQEPAPGGAETILLVEPEPETRKLALFMLSKLGYTVIEARNAEDALKAWEEQGFGISLLVTEAPMSRINGHELAQMLTRQNPALRVLYLSDADYERLARRAAGEKGLMFLQRPFTMQSLSGKVRQALDKPIARAQAE